MKQNHLLSVRNVTVMAMFGALAAVLMILRCPFPLSRRHFTVWISARFRYLWVPLPWGLWQALSWSW